MVKRIFFFKDDLCFEYDPRPGTDRVVKGPTPIGGRFKGLNASFAAGIDAAVNWGDGFVYLFKGNEYWKYDALGDRASTPTPTKIAAGWKTFPPTFAAGIDAAFNSGEGRAYFFKGDEYLRYHVPNDRVDAPDPGTSPYPRKISDPNGWRGLPASFASGIDAAVSAGDGKIYFFKGGEYVRLTFASRRVDQIQPPYPLPINPAWSGIPSALDAGIEWIEAGAPTLQITLNPSGCQRVPGSGIGEAALGQAFTMDAVFSGAGYPRLCGCAEYRQFVRGSFIVNGVRQTRFLPDPAGGPPIELLPRPAPGAGDDNFREDGNTGTVRHYGHRDAGEDPNGKYDRPDQRSGCRYAGKDAPLVSDVQGSHVEVDLDFRGVIVDACAGNEVLVEKFWSVRCSGVL